MTQDERWLANWTAVMDFITANHRNPSKHRIEEHLMLNWVKQPICRKSFNSASAKTRKQDRRRQAAHGHGRSAFDLLEQIKGTKSRTALAGRTTT